MADLSPVDREREQARVARLAALADAPTPPTPLGISDEDWGALAPDDRKHMVAIYVAEVEETLRDVQVELPRITVPTGGGTMWMLPDGTAQKTIEGVIIYHSPARAFWENPDVTNTPPQCASADGRRPVSGRGPTGAATCLECPKNVFGTGKRGRGKACKEVVKAFNVIEGIQFPALIVIPPSSLKNFARYTSQLLCSRPPRPFSSLTTVFGLERRQQQNTYSVITFTPGRPLPYRGITEVIRIRDQYRGVMSERAITEADADLASAPAEGGETDDPSPARGDQDRPTDL